MSRREGEGRELAVKVGCSPEGSGILFDCPCSTFVIFSGGFKAQ